MDLQQTHGFTFKELSDLSGLTEDTILGLQQETQEFTDYQINALARAFMMTPEHLKASITDEDYNTPPTPPLLERRQSDILKPLQLLSPFEVGRALRQKRMSERLSISDLGRLMETTYHTIRSFERGTTILNEMVLLKMAAAYQEPPENVVEELLHLHDQLEQNDIEENPNIIERRIEFSREYKQAGISLLSEFTNILQSEFGEESASVTILQKGNSVTLRIEGQDGNVKEIEKRLDDYSCVLSGELPVEKFTKDKELIQELKTKFEVIFLELRLTKDRHLEYRADKESEIANIRTELSDFKKVVAAALTSQTSLIEVIKTLTSKNSVSDEVLSKMTEIASLASATQTKTNKELLKKLLAEVQKKEPSFFQKMVGELATIPAAVTGGVATPWVQNLLSALPK